MKRAVILVFGIFALQRAYAQKTLEKCFAKQVRPLNEKSIELDYTYDYHSYGHSFKPYATDFEPSKGDVWMDGKAFYRLDTLNDEGKLYPTKLQYAHNDLLQTDEHEKLQQVNEDDLHDFSYSAAIYNPAILLNAFYRLKVKLRPIRKPGYVEYEQKIGKNMVTIMISSKDTLIKKVEILSFDELQGDVHTEYVYADYTNIKKFYYPQKTYISRFDGHIKDTVFIRSVKLDQPAPSLITKPVDYSYLPSSKADAINYKLIKFNDYIHFLDIYNKGVENRSVIVEFKDYFFVGRAPKNTENGELIINEVKKINPNKPIKYFMFGHHQPWGLGGIRAFVNEGCTVITSKEIEPYLQDLVKNPRTLHPDKQSVSCKPLKTLDVNDSLAITDGTHKLVLYQIGKYTHHSDDYLITYFPAEKMIFEDDLVWIKNEGPTTAAIARQKGFYQAVKDKGLKVNTVIQSWPIVGYGYRTVIPFQEIEKSVTMK